MTTPRQLDVRVGWCSDPGDADASASYVGAFLGTPAQRVRHGIVAAIADGTAGAGGRAAAETAVRSLIDFYVGQAQPMSVRRAVGRATAAINSWLHAQRRHDPLLATMSTTLTALILRGRQAHIVHVGHSRLYRLRDGRLICLTEDLAREATGSARGIDRAVGLEDTLRCGYMAEPLVEQDRLVLTTQGVHASLGRAELSALLEAEPIAEAAAGRLIAAAIAAGGGNAAALVADIVTLPFPDRDALELAGGALPILPLPEPGERVDGYLLGEQLADSRYSRIFRGTDADDGRALALKFPKPEAAADAACRAAFVREGWVAARVRSPWLGEVIEPAPGRQTRLYTVMPLYAGPTLAERLRNGPPMPLGEGVAIGVRLARALATLHRAGIIHRDVKAENVILEPGGGVRLIDLGVARLPGMDEPAPDTVPGTPSHMAPELLAGASGDERSDLYALGVTLDRLFTGRYPYGEVEPFQRPRFKTPAPLRRWRPDLPIWLDAALGRAVAVAPQDRQGDVIELAAELEAGAARPVPVTARRRSLYARDPVRVWQAVSLVLLVLLALSLQLHR